MTSLPRFFLTVTASLLMISPLHAGDPLEALFANPPAGAHPHTWWHWNNGNVTKEGITLDLEAMKRIGVTGAQIFNVKQCDLTGPVVVGSPEWLALTRHAMKEADRLGIELTMHNCPGWSESGGPWIAPEQSMQKVVWTETQVKGGAPFAGVVAQPETVQGFYRDIALFAFPASANDETLATTERTFSVSGTDGALSPIALDGKTRALLKFAKPKDRRFVQVEFAAPVKASSVTVKGQSDKIALEGSIEASEDGKNFRKIAGLSLKAPLGSASALFPETTARFFRVAAVLTNDKPGNLSISAIEFTGPRIPGCRSESRLPCGSEPAVFRKAVSTGGLHRPEQDHRPDREDGRRRQTELGSPAGQLDAAPHRPHLDRKDKRTRSGLRSRP